MLTGKRLQFVITFLLIYDIDSINQLTKCIPTLSQPIVSEVTIRNDIIHIRFLAF